ncbi:MAG: DUF418 domain-containing protein [Rubrivivax sp.]|nr:DUF418 domain-containing protein [Rubrivivax sp.]
MEATADAREPTPAPEPPPVPFVPIAENQRIEALDVVRGFALLGIFLMNIEGFNRYFGDIFGRGIPLEAKGLDWAATFFVNYFVQGKFWTIFSTLFGMGFAVMLVRAEKAGRPFVKVYLRRILALAVFGACHYIFIWDGDILFSYAVAALMLMMVLYARPRLFVAVIAVSVALGFLAEPFFGVAGGLAAVGLVALYLRSEKRLKFKGLSLPIFSLILLVVGTLVSIGAVVFWLLPDGPTEPRLPMTVFGPLLFITGWLSWKYHEPVEKRSLRLAVSLYVFAGVSMTAGALVQHFSPDPLVTLTAEAKKEAAEKAAAPAAAQPAPVVKAADKGASAAKAADKPKKSKAQRAEEMKAEREKRKLERETERAEELKLLTKGSYAQIVEYRGGRFPEKVAGDFGFGVVLTGMFLLGMWFVRSGVMENTAAHLPLFRRLAVVGISLGVGLSLASASIAVSHVPGDRYDGWGIAGGLHMLGNLPACVGYISLVVLMLHSRGPLSRIGVLAPMGRMALTNYLMQSVICGLYFYGYGLGHFGIGRAAQFVFVAVVFLAQLAFSHWWLARFRYGPMEWLWRGFTYRQVPPLRLAPAGTPTPAPAA